MGKDGGPALCSVCLKPASHRQGHQWLCPMHYRFGQMRANARRHDKAVPTRGDLGEMATFQGNRCADCGVKMNWLAKDGQATVSTLQHYRDGTMALACRSCNTRHAKMPGDTFRQMPPRHKFCPKCQMVHPFTAFAADNGRTGPMKLKSWCKECSDAAHTNWRTQNREYYNAKQREGRARRAAS